MKKISLFGIGVVLILAFFVYKFSNSAKNTQPDKINNYDLQSRCEENAQAFFNSEYKNSSECSGPGSADSACGYTDHYNKSLNKCFVEVIYYLDSEGDKIISLYDDQQRTLIGTANIGTGGGMYSVNNQNYYCDNKTDGKICDVGNKFNESISSYMSN